MSKRIRFEVLKRDKFTCQYCGQKAPDVLLHIDHIQPLAKGGDNNISNLVTACGGCNLGKGARLLSDNAVIDKQRKELEDAQEKREQLELLKMWRDELKTVKSDEIEYFIHQFLSCGGTNLSNNELMQLKRALVKYGIREMLESLDVTATRHEDKYGKIYQRSFLSDIRKWCYYRSLYGEDAGRLFYVRAIILNNFFPDKIGDLTFKWGLNDTLFRSVESGVATLDELEMVGKAKDKDAFNEIVCRKGKGK